MLTINRSTEEGLLPTVVSNKGTMGAKLTKWTPGLNDDTGATDSYPHARVHSHVHTSLRHSGNGGVRADSHEAVMSSKTRGGQDEQGSRLSKPVRDACDAPDLIPDDLFYVNFDCTNPAPKNSWQCVRSRATFKTKMS